jgi:hypothetical protein
MKTGIKWLVGLWVMVMLCGTGRQAEALTIFSENFSTTPLSSLWDPSLIDGIAVQSDGTLQMKDVATGNTLLLANAISAGAGSYRFEVDYLTQLSPVSPEGTFLDLFTASLDGTLLEVNTSSSKKYFGATTISLGQGWNRLTYDFNLSTAADISLMFTLADQNTILDEYGFPVNFTSDSTVYLDNVRISSLATPVPEPGTFLLLGAGLVGFAVLRRRNQS